MLGPRVPCLPDSGAGTWVSELPSPALMKRVRGFEGFPLLIPVKQANTVSGSGCHPFRVTDPGVLHLPRIVDGVRAVSQRSAADKPGTSAVLVFSPFDSASGCTLLSAASPHSRFLLAIALHLGLCAPKKRSEFEFYNEMSFMTNSPLLSTNLLSDWNNLLALFHRRAHLL